MTLHNCYTFNLNPPVDALLKVNNKKHKKAVVLDRVNILYIRAAFAKKELHATLQKWPGKGHLLSNFSQRKFWQLRATFKEIWSNRVAETNSA